MAGNPPPPDAPSLADQVGVDASASFEPGPTSISLCGFKFPPLFKFSFGFKLPSLKLPLPISFFFNLGINCDLDNPFDVSAGVNYGGNRAVLGPQDPDDKDAKEYENS